MRRSSKKKTATNLFPEIRAKSPYTFFAELVRVVDGDTIVLNADLGFYIKAQIKIRLADIDVPPINTKKGQAAKEGIAKMLSKNNLVVESRKRDKYGRYLAYIYYHRKYTRFEDILRHGRILNRQLLKYGLAKVYER
jgi:micrococcal nuclease